MVHFFMDSKSKPGIIKQWCLLALCVMLGACQHQAASVQKNTKTMLPGAKTITPDEQKAACNHRSITPR
jgi:uncharacterized lipoprotein YajG